MVGITIPQDLEYMFIEITLKQKSMVSIKLV